uniref:Mitochondrial fission regulator n=1 Tax=Musca domestica TaxID=7370 RepID=T1P8H4_MUSDO
MYNGCGPLPDNQNSFVNQLNQIPFMTNNTPRPYNYQSQQDMRKLVNNKNSTITSLPRHGQTANWQQESSLTQNHIYSQPITANGVAYVTPKFNTTDRHIRLTQDHFNHNNSLKYPQQYSHNGSNALDDEDGDYLHNNSHYSLPVDHNNDASPTSESPIPPTPPPPALPLRNGSCNTTGRRSTFSSLNGNSQQQQHNHINNNNNSSVATLHKITTLHNNNNNNINTGSLRHQYH